MVNNIQSPFNNKIAENRNNSDIAKIENESQTTNLENILTINGLDKIFLSNLSDHPRSKQNLNLVNKNIYKMINKNWNYFHKSQNVFKWKNTTPKEDYIFSKSLFDWILKDKSIENYQGILGSPKHVMLSKTFV